MENNGWAEYKREILYRLDELGDDIAALRKEVRDLQNEFVQQRIKAGFWGVLGGSLPLVLGIVWQLLK